MNHFKKVWSEKYLEKIGENYTFDDYKEVGQIRAFMLKMYREITKLNKGYGLNICYDDVIDLYFDGDFWFMKEKHGFKNYGIGHLISNYVTILDEIVKNKRGKK